MSFTPTELTRFIGYIAGIIVGCAFVAYGLIVGDVATAVAGAASIGVSVTAAPNVNRTAIDLSEDDGGIEILLDDDSTDETP